MDCSNGMPNDPQFVLCQNKDEAFSTHHRRSANYKPNIWKYDHLESLTCEYTEEKYGRQVEILKEEVLCMFDKAVDQLTKLQLIDNIEKLGLSDLFEEEINKALDTIVSFKNNNPRYTVEDLYATALSFRLLRQHGHNVSSEDMFESILDDKSTFVKGAHLDAKAILELFEASHIGCEDEIVLDKAKNFSTKILKNMIKKNIDEKLAKKLGHALELPLQWRVQWYDVQNHIHSYENEPEKNTSLLELAKLNFNVVQAKHQTDLKEIARWRRNLGLTQHLSFARDRLVESYLLAVGIACEPRCGSLRKWLTKAIVFITIIDDIYDVYGSLEELECFTKAVERWDYKEIQQLPEYMKICLEALYSMTNEVAYEIEEEKGWNSVLPHLQKVWADSCRAFLVEAKWYNKGYTPSHQEYLNNGWITSSGPVLSLLAFFSVTNDAKEERIDCLKNSQDIVYHASLIIRLCNDLETSAVEVERGDAPSSIVCFMREANVSEEIARQHIKSLIVNARKKINYHCVSKSPFLESFVKHTTNMARVAHFLYQHGDGFSVQDHETRDHVLSLLIEPLVLIR